MADKRDVLTMKKCFYVSICIFVILFLFIIGGSYVRHVNELYLNGIAQKKFIALGELLKEYHEIYGNFPIKIISRAEERGFLCDSRGNPLTISFEKDDAFKIRYEPKPIKNLIFVAESGQFLVISWQAGQTRLKIESTIHRP